VVFDTVRLDSSLREPAKRRSGYEMHNQFEMPELPIHLRTDGLYAYYVDLIGRAAQRIWLAAPYATRFAIAPLLSRLREGSLDVRLICRLNLADIVAGSVDPLALAELVDCGASVRCASTMLHAKAWIIDDTFAIGSANLTNGGLSSNAEAIITGPTAVLPTPGPCKWYEDLWDSLESAEHSSSFLRDIAAQAEVAASNVPAVTLENVDWGAPVKTQPEGEADATSSAWLVVGKPEWPHSPGDPVGDDYVRMHAAWCFPKAHVPHLKANERVFIIEHCLREDGKPDYAIVARATVAEDYTGKYDTPRWLANEINAAGYDRAKRWSRLIWLRDVVAVNGTIGECPSFYRLLPARKSSLRGGRFKLDPREAAMLQEAMEGAFRKYGRSTAEAQEVWWGRYARDGRRFTREYIEQRMEDLARKRAARRNWIS
jgi:hypothetical protein